MALVGCPCSCMASKRRVSYIYFYQEKFSGDRSSPLDPMRPTQLDKRLIIQISGIVCKLSFFVFWWPSLTNLTGGEKREKVQVGVLSVCRVFVYNSKSIRTYIPAVLRTYTRMYHIIYSLYLFAISFTIKITRIKAGTHRVHPPASLPPTSQLTMYVYVALTVQNKRTKPKRTNTLKFD